MPGGSKKGGGLEVGSAYKMKNKTLSAGAKGSPMQSNYSSKSPVKFKFLKYLVRDIKGLPRSIIKGGRGFTGKKRSMFFPNAPKTGSVLGNASNFGSKTKSRGSKTKS